jgi:hypothetical protein
MFAFPSQGGGGPIIVQSYDKPGRMGAAAPKIQVHKATVVDLQFNPFNDNLLASASEDCTVKMVSIPDGGLKENLSTALVTLTGHLKKVVKLAFNPAANNVMATLSADNSMKLWDVQAQSEANSLGLPDTPYWLDWNSDGSQAVISTKAKEFMVIDPRTSTPASNTPSFQGGKSARVVYTDPMGMFFGVGFGKSSSRQYAMWDARALDQPLIMKDLDVSASVINPQWEPDNGIMWLLGKGDSSIRYFEIVKEAPYLHFLSEFRDSSSQKGGGWVPKRALDVSKCEIAKCYRLMRDTVMPISFQVPRKSDLFQSDLFPDAYAGEPAVEAKAYFAGQSGAPPRVSMKPGAAKGKKSAAAFVAQKSPAELAAENAKLTARVKELEAELAKLRG